MKCYILIAALFVASVHSRKTCVNWVDNGLGTTSQSRQTVNPTSGTSSGGDNIIAKLFRKTGHALAATENAKSEILKHVIQAPASIAQGLVSGASQGLSSIAQNTGNVAANFANTGESALKNIWNGI